MTRHARKGSKMSSLPGATPWNVLKRKKYARLKEEDSLDESPKTPLEIKSKGFKTSKKKTLNSVKLSKKIVKKKKLKESLDDSGLDVPLLLNSGVNASSDEESSQPVKKRKSVVFGQNEVIMTKETSRFSARKRKSAEARRLRRQKERVTCFKCRQLGHKVEECPQDKDGKEVSGICFKCGSAEHMSKNCRVSVEAGEYPYAKCFICKEVGHLARSCPDNPRGLYPKGGSCRVCGSVEHLKANCPEKDEQRSTAGESSGLGLVITNNYASADADDPLPLSSVTKTASKSKSLKCKVITF